MKRSVYGTVVFLMALGFNGCTSTPQVTQSDKVNTFLTEYKSYETNKALAVIVERGMISGWGYSHSQPSQSLANSIALKKCKEIRGNSNKPECKVYMEGDVTTFNLN